jgi:hypothetical protein
VEKLMMLNFLKKTPTNVQAQPWFVQTKAEGLLLNKMSNGKKIDYQFIEPFITQLQDTGLGVMIDESFLLSWDDIYQASSLGGYEDLSEILNLPETTEATPTLVSFGSLTDSNFEVAISHWQDASGREIRPTLYGAVLAENNNLQLSCSKKSNGNLSRLLSPLLQEQPMSDQICFIERNGERYDAKHLLPTHVLIPSCVRALY